MVATAVACRGERMAPPRVVVMGGCGCGKTTLGRALAAALGVPYVEGDELHSPANVARMAAGIALTDDDRRDWLRDVAARLASAEAAGNGVVVACSALKRSYRDLLRRAAADLRLVYLHGDRELLEQRLAGRQGHYMPAALLHSQLLTLEPPQDDEAAVSLDIAAPPDDLLRSALQGLRRTPVTAEGPR